MADGSSSLRHVRQITETVLNLQPRSVLDLGMGTGKYGFLLREQHDLARTHWGHEPWRLRLIGVEGYEPYIGAVQRAVYDEVVVADALSYLATTQERFDVALALDILEHFTPADGVRFLDSTLSVASHVIVLTPRGFYEQNGHTNTLEHHLSWWPASAVRRFAANHGAHATVTRSRGATIAVLSRERAAAIPDEGHVGETVAMIRDRLVPGWDRLRGKTGPTI